MTKDAQKKQRVSSTPDHPLMRNKQSWDRQKVMAIVLERIATSSQSIPSILADGWEGHKLPGYTAVKEWLSEDPELAAQYARAKEDQAEWMAEEMLDIADDSRNDWIEQHDKDGAAIGYKVNGDHVSRSRLRIETRKWLMGKLKPKKYGDKTTIAGDPDNPLTVKNDLSEDQIANIAKAVLGG